MSPVVGQMRKASLVMWFPSLYVDLADHHVVADAAELVADHTELAGLGGRDRGNEVVIGMHLQVEVHRLQREAVLPIHR